MDSFSGKVIIALTIIGLLISTILSFVFVYWPIARIETQITNSTAKLNQVARQLEKAAADSETSLIHVESTVIRLDQLESAICKDIPETLPSFCGLPA